MLLKKMGVKNHAFPLALVNQDLRGVDPFNPDLTMNEMLAISNECIINPWYFFREIARAPAKAGDLATPVEANRANIALWWSFFNHITFLLIQPRQTGKSFSTDLLMVLLMVIRCQNSQFNLLTKDDTLRRENVIRIKEIIDELPAYLDCRQRDDARNGEVITINKHNNRYLTHVPQSTEKGALNKGRGLSSPVVHIDEGPFQSHIGLAIGAMLASMGNVRERAARAGAPYGVIMTTTSGQKDSPSGAWFYSNMVLGSAPWSERYYDAKDAEELEHMVRRNCPGVGREPGGKFQICGTFDHRMLGKDDKWLRKKIEESLQSGEAAERDYLNIWTSGNEKSPFDLATTTRINSGKIEAKHSEIFPEGYIFRWHLEEDEIASRMANGHYVLGIDTSEALGHDNDDICMCMIDAETAEVVGTAAVNETNLITYSIWLARFLVKYVNVTVIIERRSSAMAIIDQLTLLLPRYGQDPFRRLFNWIVNDKDESISASERYREIRQPLGRRDAQFHNERKGSFGFATSGAGRTSRNALYSETLFAAVKRSAEHIKDPQLVQQLLGLVNKNGRIDHESGGHDDMVIAWLLAYWFLQSAKHHSFYGIDQQMVFAGAGIRKEETPAERAKRYEQEEIRQEIEAIYERLTKETDDWVSRRLEDRLRSLDRRLELQEDEHFTIDSLLQSVREARRGRVRTAALSNDYTPYHRGADVDSYRDVPEDRFQEYGDYTTMAA